jgi:hypothetical protein
MIHNSLKIGFAALVLSVGSLFAQNSTLVNISGGNLPSWSNFAGQAVAAFKIATTEVTKAEWDSVKTYADANRYQISSAPTGSGASRPIEKVDWYDALKWSNAKSRQAGLSVVYTVPVKVATITRNNTTATVTTVVDHNLVTNDAVTVSGAAQSAYNITANVTRTGAKTFTYTVANGTVTPATTNATILAAVPYKVGEAVPDVNLAATGFRLPSEREWEWSAIGGASANATFGWAGSNNATAVAWSKDTSPTSSQNVGTKTANQLSLFDFSGNVYEWTFDSAGALVGRRIRGGGWIVSADSCRVLVRGYGAPERETIGFGFRLAQKQ